MAPGGSPGLLHHPCGQEQPLPSPAALSACHKTTHATHPHQTLPATLNPIISKHLPTPRQENALGAHEGEIPTGLAVRQAEGEGREPGGSSDTSQAKQLLSGDRLGGAPVCSCCTTRSFSSLNPDNYSPLCSVNTRVIAGCWNKQTVSEEN